MSEVQTYTPTAATAAIVVTDSAAQKVRELILGEDNLELKLRVFITGGGCSGFQYGFAFEEEEPAADDMIIEKQTEDDDSEDGHGNLAVKVLVDPMSFTYLVGAEIDYQEDIDGARFIIRNPNAQTTCGCGSSFSA